MDAAVGFNIFENIVPIEPKPTTYIGNIDDDGNLVYIKKYETKSNTFNKMIKEIVEEECRENGVSLEEAYERIYKVNV